MEKTSLLIFGIVLAVAVAGVVVIAGGSGATGYPVYTNYPLCKDSDGGQKYYQKGTVQIRDWWSPNYRNYLQDHCQKKVNNKWTTVSAATSENGRLVEGYCKSNWWGNEPAKKYASIPAGKKCESGKFVSA